MWQHFHSLWGLIHIRAHSYRYFIHSWATPRTHKAEKQQWWAALSLLPDWHGPLDPQMSLWPFFRPHYNQDFTTMPETQHHKHPPKTREIKEFPGRCRKQPDVGSLTHQQRKTWFFTLCWCTEGKDEKNSPWETSCPILQVRLTEHDEGQGWNVLVKTSEVGKQEKCSKHQPLFMEMLHNQLKHQAPFLRLRSQEKNKGLCAVKGPRGDGGTEESLWENRKLGETGVCKGLILMLLFQKQGSTWACMFSAEYSS